MIGKTKKLEIIIPIILSRLIIMIIASIFIIQNKTPWLTLNLSEENSLLNIFVFHDAQYYIGIAKQGYSFIAEQNTPVFKSTNLSYAFFPLYPLLIRVVHFFTGISYSLSGILISLFCFISSTLILYKLLPEGAKEYGIWLWCFNPISIYFFSIYTESLFVFLTLLSWYFYNKNKYFLCGIFIGLCILTRNTGAVWAIILFVDIIYKKIILKKTIFKKRVKRNF